MKRARVARNQHECSRCKAPIFPGHVYLDESRPRPHYPGCFDQRRTCATCVNVEPPVHGCIEEHDAFSQWLWVMGLMPKDGRLEALLDRWRAVGSPGVCVACGGAGEVLGDFGESLVPCSRCGGGVYWPKEARAAMLPGAPATPDAGIQDVCPSCGGTVEEHEHRDGGGDVDWRCKPTDTQDVCEVVAARAVLSELEKLRVWTAVERGAFIDGWVGRARAHVREKCGGSVCGWAGDDCVCRHHPKKSPT